VSTGNYMPETKQEENYATSKRFGPETRSITKLFRNTNVNFLLLFYNILKILKKE
jgi:hypothetical protein